jgi:hypothetical protein
MKCDCEETHRLDCPVPEAEAAYWASYFGLRAGKDDATRSHNLLQLAAFAPVGDVEAERAEAESYEAAQDERYDWAGDL